MLKSIMMVSSLLLILTACDGRPRSDAVDPVQTFGDAMTLNGADLAYEMTYEGEGDVTRYGCQHRGRFKMIVGKDGKFTLTVTTPTVTEKCQPGGDFETAKIYGEAYEHRGELYFKRCNVSEYEPEGLGNFNLRQAEGGFSCFRDLPTGGKDKWLSASFKLERKD